MSGLDDRLARLPRQKQHETLTAGTPSLYHLLRTAHAIHCRRELLRAETTQAGTAIHTALLTAYGPSIIGATYDADANTLTIAASITAATRPADLKTVAGRHGCDATLSGFSTLYRTGTNEKAASCHMLGDERKPPVKYTITVQLDFALHEQLLHAIIQDYLGLKPVGAR